MAEVLLQVNLTIVGGRDLPKTDTFSAIDAYIKFTPPNRGTEKTKVIDNNANPTWNHDLMIFLPFNPATGTFPKLEFELWDHNSVKKDEKVGVAHLQLTPQILQSNGVVQELSFQFEHSKHSKHHSILSVRFGEYAYAAKSLYTLISPISPGVLFHDHGLGHIPLQFPNVVLALEYEKTCVDVKLYVTSKEDSVYIDMIRVHHANSKVRRRKVTTPQSVFQKISFYEEIKMNDVPFSQVALPGQILFFLFQKELLSKVNLAEVVVKHGWKGAMNWSKASAALHDVELNRQEEEIYMKRDDSFIVVDFDDDDVDMKCMVLETPANNNIAYDFSITTNDVKKISEVFVPPKPILGGKYLAQRMLELDDVPFGTNFDTMVWYKYKVSAPIQVALFDVMKVHPF